MKKEEFLYNNIYNYYKDLIEAGKIKQGTKLPSIRRCTEIHGVSKTTIEQAYMNLCDNGYVIPKSQSGYFVSYRGRAREENKRLQQQRALRYSSDYTSTGVDSAAFDLNIWTKYVKNALRQDYRLKNYGLPQGERDLREQIAGYVSATRNCICNEDDIVIGAGVQTLLNILCALIKSENKTVYFNDLTYRQGIAVFKDRGYTVCDKKEEADILYISPSHTTKWGDIMSVEQRHNIVKYARENNKLIIEDDYASEFRDLNKPIPSLQGIDGENVIYVGTFSKMLLPSLRISFMVLPTALSEKYAETGSLYNQTVSIPDQIALKNYICDGKLSSQIKKARKLYSQKSKILADTLKSELGEKAVIEKTVTPLYVRCKIFTSVTLEQLTRSLEKSSQPIRIIPVDENGSYIEIAFSVSAVGSEKIADDMKKIAEILR